MCVIVWFQGGDQGSPSCKLLEPHWKNKNNKGDREGRWCLCGAFAFYFSSSGVTQSGPLHSYTKTLFKAW